MRNSSIIIFLFVILNSCGKVDDIKILITKSQLKYKNISSISKVEFYKREKLLDSLNVTYQYIKRNDTIFLVAENNKNEKVKLAWIFSMTKFASKLNCEKLIILKSNEILFKFCYNDVLNFLKEYDSKTDVKYSYLKRAKNSLLNIEQNEEYNLAIFNDQLVFDLIRNIHFDIFDNIEKNNITKLYIKEFDIGAWHGYDSFLISESEDTIASFSFTDWHRSVDLRRIK